MKTEAFTVLDYEELNAILRERFGWPESYNIVEDLVDDGRWLNDTDHTFYIEKNDVRNAEIMPQELGEIITFRRVRSSFRLASVLRMLMNEGKMAWGNVLIQVSW